MDAIEIKNLTKRFKSLTAVDSISFKVRKGEIFGLLGPNGAGKTTTISMLVTLLPPTSGGAFVNGFDIKKDKDNVRKSIGIVFQDQSLDEELTAYENMDFHGRLYRVPKEARKKKIIELLKLVGLEERKDDLVKTFSGGMRRRLEIARGLLHEPEVLFLDEPTLGLDPQTRDHIWRYVKELNAKKNITIIVTTHYMEEADRLCHRVAIIDYGKIIILDTPEKLKESIGGDSVTIEIEDNGHSEGKIKEFLESKEYKSAKRHNNHLTVHVKNAEKHIAEIVKFLCGSGVKIKSINMHKPTLEDVFLHFTGRTIREEEAKGIDNLRLRRKAWGRGPRR